MGLQLKTQLALLFRLQQTLLSERQQLKSKVKVTLSPNHNIKSMINATQGNLRQLRTTKF